jgi:hypothetical protein
MDTTTWWTYRTINGKSCWYRGKRTVNKKELYWTAQPRDDPLPSAPTAPTFEQTWRALMDDLNASLWLSTTPATQWKIGDRQ